MLARLGIRIASRLNAAVYRLSKGRLMAKAGGLPLLLLTTTGARSGKERTTPLSYLDDDGTFVVIASYAGQPRHPAWYHNLQANPEATVQIGERSIPVTASLVEGERRDRFWQQAVAGYRGYEGYAAKTDREIPIVALTPA